MDQQEFESRITWAENLFPQRPDYIEGYIRGLRRFYQGPQVGTVQEHETWLAFAHHWQPTKAERGRGYLDGLQGIRPKS